MVQRAREVGERKERETRLWLSSLTLPANQHGRQHWAVEDSLH